MNYENIEKNLHTILGLEWLGIHIEDTKTEDDDFGFATKTVYYYSVPEFSIIEVDNIAVNNRIKTANGLKSLAKEALIERLINTCKSAYPDDKEFIEDIKNNTSNYFKFYAKVRKGEVWNKELGDQRIKEILEEIENAAGYKEV